MYEEAGLHRFGTSLPELDEDTVPSKKPIRPEDQIVTDENGKRRFHVLSRAASALAIGYRWFAGRLDTNHI
ncbi:unnamed protein product [Ceratitis capitata]|uniref:(Mediterranean fruit fly) hypothetical protein n=1 Tax=Ceratitis capitata TaxID=7213 RepID=A0A811V0Z7_CERCA|nr:unnamed protein product [Ceratitis capitata]